MIFCWLCGMVILMPVIVSFFLDFGMLIPLSGGVNGVFTPHYLTKLVKV